MRTPLETDPTGDGTVLPFDERRGGRRRDHGRRRPGSASGPAAGPVPTGLSMTVRTGVAVVTCEGHLGTDSLRDTNRILAAAIRLRPRSIIVNLARATLDEESIPMLRLMRHVTARYGIFLSLAALPPRGADVLRQAGIAALFDIHPTLPLAMRAATTRAHRSLPRREAGR